MNGVNRTSLISCALAFAAGCLPLLNLVFVFCQFNNLCDWRVGVAGDEDEVLRPTGLFDGVASGHDAYLLAFFVYDPTSLALIN